LTNGEFYFTVQVGSFSRKDNAERLYQLLMKKGYKSYLREYRDDGKMLYRVRVGNLSTRKEAEELQGSLMKEALPTKIFP
jgi:DedD protein